MTRWPEAASRWQPGSGGGGDGFRLFQRTSNAAGDGPGHSSHPKPNWPTAATEATAGPKHDTPNDHVIATHAV